MKKISLPLSFADGADQQRRAKVTEVIDIMNQNAENVAARDYNIRQMNQQALGQNALPYQQAVIIQASPRWSTCRTITSLLLVVLLIVKISKF